MTDTDKYCNLHVHTTMSLLDGYGLPELMVKTAKEDLNQTAIAVTDHGNMSAMIAMKRACEKYGVKFIPGSELYIAPFGHDVHWRRDDGKRRGTAYHLTVLAYNQVGYSNLLQLTRLANEKGFYHVPRIDYDMLKKYNEGLIVTSGCMAGEPAQRLNPENRPIADDYRTVNMIFDYAMGVFGRDRYFIELQDHGIFELRDINQELNRINDHYSFEYLATNDSHYARPKDALGQADLLCVSANCSRYSPSAFVQNYIDHQDYYLTTYNDMRAKNYGFYIRDDAITNTLRIADMLENIYLGYEDEVKTYRFPVMPEYESDYDGSLVSLAWHGVIHRYGADNQAAQVRLVEELRVIQQLGFSSYFLCIYDLKQFCDDHHIPMTVRGSAGGSLILYVLGVTDFCPMQYGLLFERFLNVDRVSAPDADLDVAPNRRDEVINYLINKYGPEYTAQVITMNFIKGRGAIRAAARIMDLPFSRGSELCDRLSDSPNITIAKSTNPKSPDYNSDLITLPEDTEIIEVALRLEGQVSTVGIHAGAVMLSNRPLVMDYPLVRPKSSSSAVSKLLVGFDYETAETIGGIKLDILGVEALGILYDTIDMINQRHGIEYNFASIPVDTTTSYALINEGCLAEIFQLSGHTARAVTAQVQPQKVTDIMVINALARPGPLQYAQLYADRMHGVKPVEYDHHDLEPILKETYGIVIYQEQAMQISRVIAGFSGSEADKFRKAISKKKGIDAILAKFEAGAKGRGYGESFIKKLIDDLVSFGSYAFNASHACAYSRIAAKMAYLKHHYPLEFYAAALTGRIGNEEKTFDLLREMRVYFNINLSPPKVGRSDLNRYTIDDPGTIIYPLAAVKNVGKKCPSFDDLADIESYEQLTDRQLLSFKKLGKRGLESLIIVGALDHLFADRNEALDALPALAAGLHPSQQISFIEFANKAKFTRTEYLMKERELTGLYLSGHPLDGITINAPGFNDEIYETRNGQPGLFIGVISNIRLHRDRNSNLMAFVTIEDRDYNTMSVVIFASLYDVHQDKIKPGNVLRVLGKINVRYSDDEETEAKLKKYGRVSIIAQSIL